MIYINWLMKLRFLALKNSLWKDKKSARGTLSLAIAVIIGQIVLTRIFHRSFFNQAADSDTVATGMISVFFFVAVLWIYLISFFQSISSFMRNFYKSPDMSYLVTVPIPINFVFLFKFFEYIISSAKSILFLIFPLLAALGIWTDAPILYFILIIPIYLLISIIPCALGAMVAMIGLKLIPATIFNLVTPGITFIINIVFTVLFTRTQAVSMTYLSRLIAFFEKPWLTDLIPLTAGIKLFNAAIAGGRPLFALLFLLITTALIVCLACLVSKRLFFNGWAGNQLIDKRVSKKKKPDFGSDPESVHYERKLTARIALLAWIKNEWKMALRNHDMLMGSLFMFLFYVFAVFIFIYGRLFADHPLTGASLLITIASIFNIMAVSILFMPADITKDKNLWKTRYWLLKVMPLEGKDIFQIQCYMYYIPGYIISLLGLIIYTSVMGLGLHLILLASIYLTFILIGSVALYTSIELLTLTGIFEQYAFLGNLMSIVLPLLYSLLSAGSMTLFLAEDYVLNLMILSDISDVLTFPLVSLLSVFVIISTFLLSKQAFIRAWQKLEI